MSLFFANCKQTCCTQKMPTQRILYSKSQHLKTWFAKSDKLHKIVWIKRLDLVADSIARFSDYFLIFTLCFQSLLDQKTFKSCFESAE
jgi:hypothetical protein